MSRLQEVNERHRFDTAGLETYLADHLPGWQGPLTLRQFQGGQSNPTYLVQGGGQSYVMRSKPAPAARLLPSAHAIEREFRVMQALRQQGIPVPAVRVLCEDEGVIGRAFYLMEHVAGRIFWEQSLPGLRPGERAAVYDEMNRVIAALHAVDPVRAGLGDFGRPGNYFARQIARWSRQYEASATGVIDAMDRLIAWLPGHVPPGEETAVVHGDFRIDNLIFDPHAPRIIAIIDWELSTLGHPLADFSYHCMSWHIAPGGFRGIAGLDLAALGIPTESDYLRRYCERTGRAAIEHWNFYLAYNLFRLAAILQGVYKRGTEGLGASDSAVEHGANARMLAELGWEHARKA